MKAESNLSVVKKLDERLSAIDKLNTDPKRTPTKSFQSISIDQIKSSGTQMGAISPGVFAIDIETNKKFIISKYIFVTSYNLQDEGGFKYILNNDGTVKWRILGEYVEPIKEELSLYEEPVHYSSTPINTIEQELDKKISIPSEAVFYAGIVNGQYMADLFNDSSTNNGISNQFGGHLFTKWKWPVKAGAALHYEKANYKLNNGTQVNYNSISFGPQVKTKDFEILGQPIRFQAQFRIGPWANATGKTSTGKQIFKFHSNDFLVSIERPINNSFGEFVLSLYSQTQWLNLKDQTTPVNLSSSNVTNNSLGLCIAQVFE